MSEESGKKMTVNMVSESEFTVQGHGVHTAYVEMRDSLQKRVADVQIATNAKGKFDVVHIHTPGLYAVSKLLFSGKKRVVSAHLVPDSLVGSFKAAKLWRPFAKFWLTFLYNRADLVLAVSGYTKTELEQMGVTRRIEVLYNTIDTARYQTSAQEKARIRQKLQISPDACVVVGVGQVQPRKRVDIFLDMAKKMPEGQFIWVGGVPFGVAAADNYAMQRMIKHPPRNMRFTGVIPFAEVADYYKAADIFALPSEQETFGFVTVEAAAAGLPVVLRDIHDYDDTFRDGAVMAKDDDDFWRCVKQLSSDPALIRAAQNRSAKIAARFDSKAGAQRLLDLYKSLF